MVKEAKLVKKAKRLLRRAGLPRWLHRFGPKKYELWEHAQALLVKTFCSLSYRRIVELFDLLGIRCPSKSALHYNMARMPAALWQRLLSATTGRPYVGAIDSTRFSRVNASYHYLRRIDGQMPSVPVQLSAMVDTRRKRFAAAKIRVKPRHDSVDAPRLIRISTPSIVVADKGYDSEAIHAVAHDVGGIALIPVRKGVHKGFYRKRHLKQFRKRTYNRRNLVETAFSSIKRKYGSSVRCRKARTIRAEIYLKLLCHNLFCLLIDF